MVKPTLYFAAVLPLTWLLFALPTGRVMGDEVKFMQHVTGDTILTCLMLALTVTPLRRLTGWNEIIRVRRLIGLTAFWYACLHLSTYLVFDQSLSIDEILEDIVKHPWVLVGFTAFLCLLPLAITSTTGWVRRLGGEAVATAAPAGVRGRRGRRAALLLAGQEGHTGPAGLWGGAADYPWGSRVLLAGDRVRARGSPSARTPEAKPAA